MPVTESKIVKIVDGDLGSRGASTETIGLQNALITKIVEMPAVSVGAPVGGALDATLTDGTQKTQIVDAGGEAVTVTGGKLDVNATASLAGAALPIAGATEAVGVAIVDGSGNQITSFGGGTQYTEGDIDASVTGTALMWEDTSDTLRAVSAEKPLPVDLQDASVAVTNAGLTALETGNVTVGAWQDGVWAFQPTNNSDFGVRYSSNPYSEGDSGVAAWAVRNDANAAFTSTDGEYLPIAVNNKGAVAIQDGGNTITVDGTVTANTGLSQPLTDTQLRATPVVVDLSTNNDVTVTGTVTEANSAAIKTAVEVIDNAIAGSEMQVDIVSAPTLTVTPADTYAFGVKYAGEVYADGNPGNPAWAVRNDSNTAFGSANGDYSPIAVNDKGALAIQDGGNTITVDGTITANLSATDNAVLDAINADTTFIGSKIDTINNKLVSGIDIGDVTINNAAGASAVNIQDGGNTITVDGTVTANLSATDNTVLDNIDTNTTNTFNSTIDIQNKLTNGTQKTMVVPATSGGLTTYHLVSAATTNATVVKASAGQLFGWYIYNSNAAARKLVFHNTASAPTAGASVMFSIIIPPTSGANVFSDIGIAFSTGIAITTVTGLADNDTAAVAANDLIINLWYA